MNNTLKSIRTILFVAICALSHTAFAQKNDLSFDHAGLSEIIKTLEQQSDYIFNYDPTLLTDYYFTGTVNPTTPENYLSQVLYQSPFSSEIDGQTILIYQPNPQAYRVCGTIRDAGNNLPLAFTNIVANNTNTGSLSENNGFFDFTITAPKNQSITISYIGYQSKSFMVQDLTKDACPDYNLVRDDKLWSKEIIVTDYILDGITEGEQYGGYNMDYNQLSKHHSNIEHDILKTAQLMPGVTSLDESASNLQIRGSAADQNLIMWEGATLYHSGHFFGMISAINPFSVDEVNIYKGVYDPKYDNRVGGIINVSLTDSIKSKSHGSIGSTLTEAHLNLELPVVSKKVSVLLSGRHSINGIYNSPPTQNYSNRVFQFSKIDDYAEGAEQGLNDTEQLLQFHDWNAKILYQPAKKILVKAGIYKNYHRFQYNLSFPDDPYHTRDIIRVKTDAMHASLDWKVTKKWRSSLSLLHSAYENSYDFEGEENDTLLTDYFQFNDIFDQTFSFSNNYQLSSKLTVNGGYDYNVKRVNFILENKSLNEPDFLDINTEAGHFHNLFASANYKNQKWHINGGLRATYYREQNKWVTSPRMNLQYEIIEGLKLKAEGGIFHQFISQLREYGNNVMEIDNPLWIINSTESETAQKAQKVAAGFIFHKKGWLFDMEGYYTRTTGLTTLSPLFNELIPRAFSKGSSNTAGVDILLKKRLKSFNFWLNYSLGKITYSFPEITGNSFAAPNDIRHNGSIVGSYQFRKFHFSLSGKYHSGLPYSQPDGIGSVYDEVDETTIYFVDYQGVNNARLNRYFRLDFGVNYRPSFKKFSQLKTEFSLSIINLLNRENAFDREFYVDNETEAPTPPLAFIDKVLLNRTPLLLVRFYW